MGSADICEAEFEGVCTAATKLLDAAGGGALCVYLDGGPVLDVWSGQRDPASGLAWERDTMAMSWSTTKGVASTVLHMLGDRGELDYDATVASYWPEFAANGKARITVRQVMSMEAGLYDIRHLISDPKMMLDHDAMAEALADARPLHDPGTANAYHALTYGWLVGEIVRRITGETLGAMIQRDIAEPLQLDGFHIGTPPDRIERVAARPVLTTESAVARRVAKIVDPATRVFGFSPDRIAAAFMPHHANELIASREFLTVEVPSVNGVFTARSLARFYAALGSDDGVDDIRLWSPATRTAATQQQNRRRDLVLALRVGWKLGYHQPFPRKRTSTSAFGFYGAYGSGAYADPDRHLAMGLVVHQAKGFPLRKVVRTINDAAHAMATR